MADTPRMSEEELVGDLVVALLSVNAWSVEKTFRIYDGLRAQGLFDMDAVAVMPAAAVFSRLEKAGYARGDFMVGLLADRLLHLANALAGEGKETLRGLVEGKDREAIERFLADIKGVGPAVIRNYETLRAIGAG